MSTGSFVWHDLYTFEPDKAKPFYRDLFGWTINDIDMGGGNVYSMAVNGEYGIGGFGPLSTEIDPHPYWNVYLSTDDIDKTLADITANGGSIVHPGYDIPNVGRMAFCRDNQGANFSPFQGSGSRPMAPWPPKNPSGGEVVWHDHMSDDPAAAARFYGTVFGLEVLDWSAPDFVCWGLQKDGATVGVILQKPQPDVPTMWTTYIESPAPIDELMAKVTELGGINITGKMHHPGFGDFVVIEDPSGGVLSAVVSEMWRGE